MKSYYVYLHRKATTGEVFYVGKGSGDRATNKHSRTKFWKRTVAKHGFFVEYVVSDVQEWYALELERDLVDYYGRVDLKTGTLVNLCDGGAASTTMNDEVREKMRQSKLGTKASIETRLKLSQAHKGRTFSKEHLAKLSEASKRRGVSPYTRAMCIAAKSKTVYRDDGEVFRSTREAARHIVESGVYPKARHGNISAAALGKVPRAYGYRWSYQPFQ